MVGVVASILLITAATASPPRSAVPAPTRPAAANSEEAFRHYAQGRLLEERGDSEQALVEYYRALLIEPRAVDVARRVSEIAARLGEPQRSMEFADRVLEIEPGDSRALWLKGAALFNIGRVPESLPFLERAVSADSTDAEMLRTLARVAEHLDRVDLVARANQRVVQIDEEDGESWFQLATARARLGDFAEADRALDRAAEINPLRPGMLFMRAWVKEGLGKTEDAIDFYRRHLAIHAGDQVARRRFVHLLGREKRFDEAYREVRVLARATPNDFDVIEVEADLALQLKRSKEAEDAIGRLERLAGDDPEPLGRLVTVLARFQRKQAAFRVADQWAKRHPDDCRGAVLKARARSLSSEPAAAADELARAIEMCPDSLAPRVLLARSLQEEKRFDRAEVVWVEAARRFPDHVGVALDLAYCREQLGDLAGAQQAARDALAKQPENPTVLNFLGYLLADHNRDLIEAEKLIGRALQKDPGNGAYVDSMGWVYYRLGRLADARRELERAVHLTQGDPVVHEHLGDVYKDLKLIDLAKDQYQKSLSGDASNQRVRAKLMELR